MGRGKSPLEKQSSALRRRSDAVSSRPLLLQPILTELRKEIRQADSGYALLDLIEEYSVEIKQQLAQAPARQAFDEARALLLDLDVQAAAARDALETREQQLRSQCPHDDMTWASGGIFHSDKEWNDLERRSTEARVVAKTVRASVRSQADLLGLDAEASLAQLWHDETAVFAHSQHAQWAQAHGLSWDDYYAEGSAHLQQLVDSAQLAIRIPEMAFASVLKQGRFLTQHEISRSRGYKNAAFRELVEHQLFGAPLNRKRPFKIGDKVVVDREHRRFPGATGVVIALENGTVEVDLDDGSWKVNRSARRWSGGYARGPQRLQKDDLQHADLLDMPRPVYGYLTDSERDYDDAEECVNQYGAVRVIVNDTRRADSTVTFGDSLDMSGAGRESEHRVSPAPLTSVDVFTAGKDPFEITDVYAGRPAGVFTEVQYHNGLRVEDIAEVHFTRRLPTAAVAKALAKNGIPWRAPNGELFNSATHKLQGGLIVRVGDDPYGDVVLWPMTDRMKAAEKTANYLRHPPKIDGTTSSKEPTKSMYLNDQLLYERARELEDEHPLTIPAELDAFEIEQLSPAEQLRQLEAARDRGCRVSKRLLDGTRRWAEGTSGRPVPLPRYVFGHGERADALEAVWEQATPPERIALLNQEDARKKAETRAREIAGEKVYNGRNLWHETSYGQWSSRWVKQLQDDAARWTDPQPATQPGADGEPTEEMVHEELVKLLMKARVEAERHSYRSTKNPSSAYERDRAAKARAVVERAEAALAGAGDPLAGLVGLREQAIEDLAEARETYRRHLSKRVGTRSLVVASLESARKRLGELNERLGLHQDSEHPYEEALSEVA